MASVWRPQRQFNGWLRTRRQPGTVVIRPRRRKWRHLRRCAGFLFFGTILTPKRQTSQAKPCTAPRPDFSTSGVHTCAVRCVAAVYRPAGNAHAVKGKLFRVLWCGFAVGPFYLDGIQTVFRVQSRSFPPACGLTACPRTTSCNPGGSTGQ